MKFPPLRVWPGIVFAAVLLLLLPPAATTRAANAGSDGWTEISRTATLVIYERAHAGSSYKEVKAVGTFAAPNWVVKNVLDDTERYPKFMPHMVEAHVVTRDPAKHTVTVYGKLDPPVVSMRDYTILVQDESHRASDGQVIYQTKWTPANDKGPAEKSGVVRVKVNEGAWLLEPTDGGQHTKGTYILYTDGGGGMPAMLLNSLNKRRLTELFEALATTLKDDKYTQQGKPAFPP